VNSTDDAWRIDVPLPGIDPKDVTLEVAGNTLSIRVGESDQRRKDSSAARLEQTMTVPQFLDLDKLTATHRHGMLQLTVPLKDSVKPRRIQIASAAEEQKQLTAV
jgi:HSP20 family protein